MEYLLENHFYLFIIIVFFITLSLAGIGFGLIAFFVNFGTITFKESVMSVFKGLAIIILVSFILGTLSYLGASLFADLGIDASCVLENPYY